MTREQAIALAIEYLGQQGLDVHKTPEAVRHMDAARFNRLFGREQYPSDFWIVEFPKVLPHEAAESPGTVMLEVIDCTGRVREVHVGNVAE